MMSDRNNKQRHAYFLNESKKIVDNYKIKYSNHDTGKNASEQSTNIFDEANEYKPKTKKTLSDIFQELLFENNEYMSLDSDSDSDCETDGDNDDITCNDDKLFCSSTQGIVFPVTASFCILNDTERIINTMIYNLSQSSKRDVTHLYKNSASSTGYQTNLFYIIFYLRNILR